MWFDYNENQKVRETLDGYEIIQAIWLDTCPYNPNQEYCVVQANLEFDEEIYDLQSAVEYFDSYCVNDNHIVKDECSKEEALVLSENG